jgi:crossover junction endodeoxyribonuclease RusA
MIDVSFALWPPSVNHGWRNVGNRTCLSAAGRDFRHEMQKSVLALRSEKKLPLESILGPLEVGVTLYPPDKRVRDIDNYCKAIFDAFTHAKVWQDDSQVKELHIRWGGVVKGGGYRIEINPFVERV